MRWFLLIQTFLLVGAWIIGRDWMLREFKDGWRQVCYGAPHRRLSARQLEGLEEANIMAGRGGWQPTVGWVNEQCRVLGID